MTVANDCAPFADWEVITGFEQVTFAHARAFGSQLVSTLDAHTTTVVRCSTEVAARVVPARSLTASVTATVHASTVSCLKASRQHNHWE